ncbi:MAG: hypothetical protein ACJ718_10975 [Nitrososphaeraceae archaeon]
MHFIPRIMIVALILSTMDNTSDKDHENGSNHTRSGEDSDLDSNISLAKLLVVDDDPDIAHFID